MNLNDLPKCPKNGKISLKCNCKDCSVEVSDWYDSGNIKTITSWSRGKAHGRWISWFEDKKIKFYVEYKEGKLCGEFKSWENKGEYKLIKDQIWERDILKKDYIDE
jgi:antitoxin component YwqK of YwqJK toxin-antitoxin module